MDDERYKGGPRLKTSLEKQFAPWRYLVARTPPPPGPHGGGYRFYLHRHANEKTLVIAVILIGAIEAPLIHLLIASWNHTVAWVVTGLTVLTVLWLLGFTRAGTLRASHLGDEELVVVDGMFEEVHVPLSSVASTSVTTPGAGTHSTFELTLDRPVTVKRFAGPPETVTTYAFDVADEAAIARLRERLPGDDLPIA